MENVQNILSAVAIIISLISLGISLYTARLEDSPYVCLKAIKFNKEHFGIVKYSKGLPAYVRKIIEQTKQSISIQKLYGKEYLLVNLVDAEETNLNNAKLVLSPMECIYVSRGGHINEIILKKASMALKNNPKEIIKKELTGEEKIVLLDRDEIVIRIAYVHNGPEPTSINYMDLINETQDFDYLMDIEKAEKYINFVFEKFIFIFKNYKGKKYKKKMMLTMDAVKGLKIELK